MPPAVAVVAAAFTASAAFSGGIVLFGVTLMEAGFAAAAVAGLGSFALGFVSQALAPKPPTPAGAVPFATAVRENTIMVRQAITARRLVYGWTRVSGPQTFVHSTSNDEKLHIVLTLSTHQFSRLDALLFDDEVVPLDGDGLATGKYAGKVRAFFGDGTTSGDATFHSKLTESVTSAFWSSAHLQTGCAKLYIELSYSSDIFPVGVPNISAICRAKNNISDPRTGGSGWTDNAALCINDWLKSSFGYNWPSANIDSTTLTAAANVCDEMVSRNPTFTFTANAGTDVVTVGADMPSNTRFRVSNSGGALPAGLSATTTYFWIRSSATTGKVATSKANVESGTAVDITDAGTGTHTYTRVVEFTVDASTDVVTLTDTKMGLRNGTRFQVAADTTLPAGLSAATNYFWIAISTTTGKIATTLANSRAGTAVDITDAGTGTLTITVNAEPRYTLNGVVDTEQGVDETIGKLLSAMAGLRITQGKTIYLYAGAWRAPSVTLDEDDLAGGISVQARRSRRDLFNGVKGVFSNPDDLWQPTDFPPVQVTSYVTEDDSVELWRDAELPYTNSPTMAQRICRIDLERARRQITTTWPCKLVALRIAGADVISLTNTRMGWTAKSFEVAKWVFTLTGDRQAPSLGIKLEVREVDANVYAWTPSTDEAVMQPAPSTNLPNPFTVAAPTNLTLASGTAVLGTRLDGTIFSRILVTWTAPTSVFVTSGGFIEGEVRKSSEADNWRPAFTIRGDLTQAYVLDVDDGVSYVVRIRGKTVIGTMSAWTTSSAHTVAGKSVPPSNVSEFSAQQNGNVVIFKWGQVSDIDLSGYEVRYALNSFVWADALTLTAVTKGTQVTSAAVPPSPVDSITGLQIPWIFGIKAVDTSGNYSTTELTTTLVVLNTFDIVETQENWPFWLDWETGRTIAYSIFAYSSNTLFGVTGAAIGGVYLKNDGSKLYLVSRSNGQIYQYTLPTPWDVRSLSYDSVSYLTGGSTSRGLFISPDGAKLYLMDDAVTIGSRALYQHSLITPWDLSTASSDAIKFSLDLSGATNRGVFFKPDGTKMYLSGTNKVNQYNIASAWNISTASYEAITYVSSAADGVSFSPSGDRMYGFHESGGVVRQFNLSSPWDLRAVVSESIFFSTSEQLTTVTGLHLKPDGTQVYLSGVQGIGVFARQYSARGGFHRNPWTGNLNPLDQSSAGGDNFNVFNNYCTNPVSFAVFEGAQVDVGLDITARVWTDVGANLGPGVSSGSASAASQVDYRTSTGSFDGFESWTVGDAATRYVKARVVSNAGGRPTRLTRFNLTVDAEEVVEVGSVSILGAGGTTVVLSKQFTRVPQVRTWNAEATAKIPGFESVTNSTFIARLYDSTGAVTSGVNFWEARGV